MVIVVDDKRQNVSFCGISFEQFFHIKTVIQIARTQGKGRANQIANALNLNCLYYLDYERQQISLLQLSWEQVFMLNATMISLQQSMNADKNKLELDYMIAAIEAAVESDLRTDASLENYA